jgi:PAS domain S-box-containing protein
MEPGSPEPAGAGPDHTLLRGLLDQAPFPLYLRDLDGRIALVNRLGAELVGQPAGEVLGRTPDEFYGEQADITAVVTASDRSVIEGGEAVTFEVSRWAVDGTARDYLVTKYPVRDPDGQIVGVGGISLDITDHREMESRLRQAEDRFREAFDGAAIGMAVVSPEGRYLLVNRALCDLLGYSEEELLEKTYPDITHPEDLDADHELARKLLDGELHSYQSDKRYLHRGGHAIPVRRSVALVRDADGKPLHYVSQHLDISEQRRSEALADQLRHAQKLDALGRLAGGVAHDFNNMLTAIRGYGELLVGGLSEDDPLRHSAEQICRAAEQASTLPRQLLAFSRNQTWETIPVDLNEVLTGAGDMLGRLLGATVELTLSPGARSPVVESDHGYLEQVLVNLAVNAREAIGDRGMVRISTRDARLAENERPAGIDAEPGEYVVLAVADDGEGMDTETRERAFEPFFTTKATGSGLGLSTVYGIVSQSRGFVRVESHTGEGTIVEVWLPRAAPAAEASPGRPGGARSSGEAGASESESEYAGRVLVVEDEKLVRDLTVAVLERGGYEVLAAADGREALEVIDQSTRPIDVLLSDMVMPGMSGRELAERFTALQPGSRVLLMSGYADELAALADADVLPGGVSYLQKPAAEALLQGVAERLPPAGARTGRSRSASVPWPPPVPAQLRGAPEGITCLIADDHPAVREAVGSYLASNRINVTASVARGDEALEEIIANPPAIALLDIRMAPLTGIEVARRVSADVPQTQCVLYTGYSDRMLLNEALDAGARGFIRKEAPMTELLHAISTVFCGNTYVDPKLAGEVATGAGVYRLSPLTPREKEILAMVADGMTNDRVAARLGISPETVQSHVRHAMGKLDAETRTQAVATALRRSLLV